MSESAFRRYFMPRDIDASLASALYAETLGTLLFTLFASRAEDALGYAFSYAVFVYATQHVSGGHLNPAVTLSVMVAGFTHIATGLMYMAAQVAGALLGALLQIILVPGLHLGKDRGLVTSCFFAAPSVSRWQLFGWELLMTFALIYLIYAVEVAEPGHGSIGPLVLGFVIYIARTAGGRYTGAALNPALVLGSAIVFRCNRDWWVYLLAELLGAALAAGVSVSVMCFGESRRMKYGPAGPGCETEPAQEPLLGGAPREQPIYTSSMEPSSV